MIRRIRASILARYQNFQRKHFEWTKYGRAIALLKDTHKGESCFLIGNGPSLKPEDLDAIWKAHIPSFGTNRIYTLFDKTDWRPAYYVSEDADVMKQHQEEVSALSVDKKFIPINLKWDGIMDIGGADYYLGVYDESVYEDTCGLSLDAAHGVVGKATVMGSCFQLAIYMGFSRIYLLGVDHSFSKMIDLNGNVTVDSSVKNHFNETYDVGVVDKGFAVDHATKAYMQVEALSRKLGTFRVFNATRGGKLEVFERVDFDQVMSEVNAK